MVMLARRFIGTKAHLLSAIGLTMVLAGCGEQQPSSTSAAPAVARGGSRQQFLEGYRAYTQHNWPAAMSDLRAAADSYPQLGDYSLYYLSRSAFESGDLSTAAASANRLIEMYPQSVMAMRARVLLADI